MNRSPLTFCVHENILRCVRLFVCVVLLTMMFNGLLVCGDSDTSDFTKDSMGAFSRAGSVASDTARCRRLEDQLQATLLVLKNKEETIHVQGESLVLAEARIAQLAARTRTAQHTCMTRDIGVGCCVETSEASADTRSQVNANMVDTLQDNLTVIENLYRECFYETAKQQDLIDMLRKSYLDVRLMERDKADQIGRLQNMVNSHKWSIQTCQDIALEVDNLKAEISNFLNSSNNDSGMWEGSEAGPLGDVRAIAAQLLTLRELLANDCTCNLQEENMKLKKINETMEIELGEHRQRLLELEACLQDKGNVDRQLQKQIEIKEQELQQMRGEVCAFESREAECAGTCEALRSQLQQIQVFLDDKSEELQKAQQQSESQQTAINELKEQLSRASALAKERATNVRAEVGDLSRQVRAWRRDLQRTQRHAATLSVHYAEKCQQAEQLQEELEEAQQRGMLLCGDAQRVVSDVRRCLRRARLRNREQEEKIKEQELLIRRLQQKSEYTSSDEPCCSKYARERPEPVRVSRTASCCKCPPSEHASASEMASPPPPTPPRRWKKKSLCETRCEWSYQSERAATRVNVSTDTHACHFRSMSTCPREGKERECGRPGGPHGARGARARRCLRPPTGPRPSAFTLD